METPKKVVFLLNGTQYTRPKIGRTQYAGLNEAVPSTQVYMKSTQ